MDTVEWAIELLRDTGTEDFVNPPTAEAMNRCADELEALRQVTLTDEEYKRLLWWLFRPVPPGPMRDLDNALIRKLTRASASTHQGPRA